MPRFTQDNTAGYRDADLLVLNARFEDECGMRLLPLESEDLWIGSHLDYVAERVLADFDRKAGA